MRRAHRQRDEAGAAVVAEPRCRYWSPGGGARGRASSPASARARRHAADDALRLLERGLEQLVLALPGAQTGEQLAQVARPRDRARVERSSLRSYAGRLSASLDASPPPSDSPSSSPLSSPSRLAAVAAGRRHLAGRRRACRHALAPSSSSAPEAGASRLLVLVGRRRRAAAAFRRARRRRRACASSSAAAAAVASSAAPSLPSASSPSPSSLDASNSSGFVGSTRRATRWATFMPSLRTGAAGEKRCCWTPVSSVGRSSVAAAAGSASSAARASLTAGAARARASRAPPRPTSASAVAALRRWRRRAGAEGATRRQCVGGGLEEEEALARHEARGARRAQQRRERAHQRRRDAPRRRRAARRFQRALDRPIGQARKEAPQRAGAAVAAADEQRHQAPKWPASRRGRRADASTSVAPFWTGATSSAGCSAWRQSRGRAESGGRRGREAGGALRIEQSSAMSASASASSAAPAATLEERLGLRDELHEQRGTPAAAAAAAARRRAFAQRGGERARRGGARSVGGGRAPPPPLRQRRASRAKRPSAPPPSARSGGAQRPREPACRRRRAPVILCCADVVGNQGAASRRGRQRADLAAAGESASASARAGRGRRVEEGRRPRRRGFAIVDLVVELDTRSPQLSVEGGARPLRQPRTRNFQDGVVHRGQPLLPGAVAVARAAPAAEPRRRGRAAAQVSSVAKNASELHVAVAERAGGGRDGGDVEPVALAALEAGR